MDYLQSHPLESSSDAKSLGAYYTDPQIADFLAWWAIRSAADTVLDPCFGGGIFLRSACQRLQQLGGPVQTQVFGVEIDGEVHRRIATKLVEEYCLLPSHLTLADFFALEASPSRLVDVVIGNPPFIRYQRFTGQARKLGLARSLAQGVRLPQLCSSWAPFVIHSIAMLRPGGRLAVVLPMELAHAKYARPLLEHLRHSFAAVTFLTFRQRLFPNLSEDTLLVLADAKGQTGSQFLCRDLAHSGILATLRGNKQLPLPGTTKLNAQSMATGKVRLIEQFVPRKAQELYARLRLSKQVERLGNLADVGIGYVTGANDFFHLDAKEARQREIPHAFLKPAVRRGRSLVGLRFTTADWQRAAQTNEAGYLLHLSKNSSLPASVRRYLDEGEGRGVPRAYKCRARSPWYCVPHVYKPDAFLTYMSGVTPRLIANDAGAFAPNSLHVLRLHSPLYVSNDGLAALWQTSLTRLSVEIEGHALGGGMLKLEPTEAENVLVPSPTFATANKLKELAADLDILVRERGEDAARQHADSAVLIGMLGFDASECALLQKAARSLQGRRYRDVRV